MRVLLIGYGSIGKRHEEVLLELETVDAIDIVTKQILDNKTCFPSLEDIDILDEYDYFVIASETFKHYAQLKYICSRVDNKIILVEKPLFEKKHISFTCQNHVFVAYNLRFHPVLQKLKILLKDKDIYYVNIICGQYLPTWRPDQDYRESYSANLNQGGGVLRDLSHEIDYANWLFGKINILDSINTHISDLDINSDDIFTAIATTDNKSIVNLTMDYISKNPMRKLIIHTRDNTIEADVNNNTVVIYSKNKHIETLDLGSLSRNDTYKSMHKAILIGNYTSVCTLHEGLQIIDVIDKIRFKELK